MRRAKGRHNDFAVVRYTSRGGLYGVMTHRVRAGWQLDTMDAAGQPAGYIDTFSTEEKAQARATVLVEQYETEHAK